MFVAFLDWLPIQVILFHKNIATNMWGGDWNTISTNPPQVHIFLAAL